MIAAWMLRTLMATVLVTIAASLLDRIAGQVGSPRRWVWAGALATSVALPIGALCLRWTPPAVWLAVRFPVLSKPIYYYEHSITTGTLLGRSQGLWALGVRRPSLHDPLFLAWMAVSAATLALYVGVQGWLVVRKSRWTSAQLDAHPVLLTPAVGPAVIGVRHQVVVLPAWVLVAPAAMQRVILQHEREHISAGDSRLLALAALIVVVMPWNLVLWWQYGRLRAAIETDCDARVLEAGTDIRQYGEVLLSVASRSVCIPFLSPAFGVSGSSIERRILAMTAVPRRRCRTAVIAVAGAAFCACVTAFDVSSAVTPWSWYSPLATVDFVTGSGTVQRVPGVVRRDDRGGILVQITKPIEVQLAGFTDDPILVRWKDLSIRFSPPAAAEQPN